MHSLKEHVEVKQKKIYSDPVKNFKIQKASKVFYECMKCCSYVSRQVDDEVGCVNGFTVSKVNYN